MNIQTVTQKWPATAGIGHSDNTSLNAFWAQSAYDGYDPDEEQMRLNESKKKKK